MKSEPSPIPKLCYSYIRFSSKRQELGQSFTRQKGLAEEWCAQNNGILDATLNMHDLGVSGFKGHNLEDTAALGGFLKSIQEGRVPKGSYLLIENFDRLTRQQTDPAYQLFRSILLSDINIVTLGDKKVYTKDSLNNFTDIIVSIITMSRAHEEIARKAELLRKKWEERRKNIKTKKIATKYPSWLSLSADYTTFSPIPERVSIIEGIFNDYIAGTGVVTIAANLNKAGVPCMSSRSKIWKTHYIQQLLRSRALIGEYQPKKRGIGGTKLAVGPMIPDYFPVVIMPSIFNKVQFLLGKIPPKKKTETDYGLNLFSTKLFCPYCGERMFVAYQKSAKTLENGKRAVYGANQTITCVSAKNGKCINIGWPLADFEEKFFECSDELKLAFKVDKEAKTNTAEEIGTLRTQIESRHKAIENYQKSFEEAQEAPQGAMKRWRELEAEASDLSAQLNRKVAAAEAANEANPYSKLPRLENLDADARARVYRIIQTTIEKIYVFFAGTRFNYARCISLRKRMDKQAQHPTKTAYAIRNAYKIKTARFFTVHLNNPGKDRRLTYPKQESALADMENYEPAVDPMDSVATASPIPPTETSEKNQV